MPRKIGLALAGGGGKGAYQVGVWKAMEALGLTQDLHAVAGTSIGALNGTLFAQGDPGAVEEIWLSMSPTRAFGVDAATVMPANIQARLAPSMREMLTRLPGGVSLSRRGLEMLIETYLRPEALERAPITAFATCVAGFPLGPARYFALNGQPADHIKKVLCASSAIPFMFDPVPIEDTLYSDGGIGVYGDNTPVRPLHSLGCDTIIVVHLNPRDRVNPAQFPGSRIIQVNPSKSLGDMIGGNLDFVGENARWRMALGFEDGLRQLAVVDDPATAPEPQAAPDRPARVLDPERMIALVAKLQRRRSRWFSRTPE